MNNSIHQLADLSSKPSRVIIGLMSGTSLDGLDVALCRVEGSGSQTHVELMDFTTFSYPGSIAGKLKPLVSVDEVSLRELCLAHTWMAEYHAGYVLEALEAWGLEAKEIDCIASHGQTVYHVPGAKHGVTATLQIGDGDHIARKTGILTISDFRQKHTASGGEGAPMVSPVDRLLYTHPDEDRILLNIGGIANFAFLPATGNPGGKYRTGDTGPGNILINTAMYELFGKEYDLDGATAASGNVNKKLLEQMKKEPWFSRPLPKTTGPEQFNMKWVGQCREEAGVKEIPSEDLVATLTRLTAETIVDAILQASNGRQSAIYIGGGGAHNKTLTGWLQELLEGYVFGRFEAISGYSADAKEAVAFAVLANEALSGDGFLIEGVKQRINFGKVSFPT